MESQQSTNCVSRDYVAGPWHKRYSGMPDLDILVSNSLGKN